MTATFETGLIMKVATSSFKILVIFCLFIYFLGSEKIRKKEDSNQPF